MKKSSFMHGAFIATLGIVITKIIGILYVIPFYQIIGEKGGALYGYAYNIYNIFLNISSAGIPMAISKIISEYNVLGLYEDKKEAFRIGKKMAIILSSVSFIILFFFAPFIAYLIIGDVQGGNTIYEITLVIRIISTAIIIVPILSIYRGYFQGHKYIKPTSISQIIEQLVRVSVILIGSYLTLKVFNLSLTTSVGIAVFGATVGALFSYFYILKKYYDNKSQFEKDKLDSKRTVSSKDIFKQIIIYAIPLVLIDVFKSLYNSVDMITLVKTLVNGIGYQVKDAESIMSVISTWGLKLNMIVTSIGSGIVISLVPNLSESYITNNQKGINDKVNKTLQVLLFFTLPMTVGLSLLSKPIWIIFYGYNELGFTTFSYSIFIAFFLSLFLTMISITQLLKEYKVVIISLIIGILSKLILNVPLIYLFNRVNLPPYYGSITASIIGYLIPFIICMVYLKKKFNLKYQSTMKSFSHILLATVLMAITIILTRNLLPYYSLSRVVNIPIVILYTILGGSIYFVYMWKSGMIFKLFGNKIIKKIKDKVDNLF